jgi:hypothetical protein
MPYGSELTNTRNARWYGIGSQKTLWYNTIHFHLGLVAFFLLAFLGAVVISLVARLNSLSRFTLGLTGIVNLAILVGWALTVNYLLNTDAESSLPVIPMSNILPWLTLFSSLLAVGLTYLFAKNYHEENLSKAARNVFGLVVFAAWLLLPFMGYWNLLGGRL